MASGKKGKAKGQEKRQAGEQNSVVKIDYSILKKVEEYINKPENKLKYVNKKQFVDIAVFEKLKKEGGKG